MKSKYQLFLLLFALPIVLTNWSCSTSSISIQVLVPAHITVPQDVQMLALVNRYRPGKGEGFLNILEGAISGENIGQDRRAAESALGGLTQALAGSPRFKITRPAIELKGTGRADFPDPLAARRVKEICRKNNANALVTIEAFDSDTRVSTEVEQREKKKDGKTIKYNVFVAKKAISVTVGWRMYNAIDGSLIDEYRMYETVHFTADGPSEKRCIANLPNRDRVTQRIGDVTGAKYSRRISPTWIWVSRQYFKKGCDELKAGKQKVKWKDWAGAHDKWTQALDYPDDKVKGRALYNLAFHAELYGELREALELVKKAGQTYGNKKAVSYASVLRARIRDQERLNSQMEGAPK